MWFQSLQPVSRLAYMVLRTRSTNASVSTLGSNIYFPALPTIAHDLQVSGELVNLTVTSYLIFQGVSPSLWGPISDVKGRRIAYIGTLIVAVGACIGLAETKNYATLIVLRCLQSAGSASTIAIGSGVVGDITTRADRGGYMGFFQGITLISIAIGPIIGGVLAGSLGWRSIFWFMTAYSAVLLLLLSLLLPETLRSIVGNGSRVPDRFIAYPLTSYQRFTKVVWDADEIAIQQHIAARKRVDILGPLRMLVSKQAAPIVFFFSVYFAVWQMSITAMSTLFKSRYGLTDFQTGLTFIANGAGSIIGTLATGKILDWDYRLVQQSLSFETAEEEEYVFPLEKARLRFIPVFATIQCLSLLVFGWTIQYSDRVHIAVPIVTTFITGWMSVSTQSIVSTYMVDMFQDRSAAATASLNLARCCLAAAGSSAVLPMINGVGVGVAFTICVAIKAVASTGLFIQWKYGARWRQSSSQ